MVLLVAPNGVPVHASDEAAPRLLADGWTRRAAPIEKDYSTLTVAQLKELCAERGIDVPKRATKAQVIALLE
jgi:hypothetical protein